MFAVVLIFTGGRFHHFLGWMLAVPAACLVLLGSVARGIQLAREEEAVR